MIYIWWIFCYPCQSLWLNNKFFLCISWTDNWRSFKVHGLRKTKELYYFHRFNKRYQFFGKFRNNYSLEIQLFEKTRDKISKAFLSILLGQSGGIYTIRDDGIWIVMLFETFKNIVFRDNFLVSLFLYTNSSFFCPSCTRVVKFLFLPFTVA